MRNPTGPVVALDIDGTIGDWHEGFRDFAQRYTGRTLAYEWEGAHGKAYKALGLSKTLYRKIKVAYRQSGLKRAMPVFPGSSEMTRRLRNEGAQIWVCTTRPYLKYDGIDDDTRHWLRRNGIQYDGLLYGERKYGDLVKIVGAERVAGVIDDLPEMVTAAFKLGIPAILRARPHNFWWWTDDAWEQKPDVPWSVVATSSGEMADYASSLVRVWKEKHA